MESLPDHVLSDFDTALKRLNEDLFLMASIARRALTAARSGLTNCDQSVCQSVISDDSAVDELEKQVDEDGFDIIMRFQPVASDLRQVLAVMRACKDLERIGDLAVSISRRACQIQTYGARLESGLIEPLFEQALELFSDAMRAFAQRDMTLANSVILRDEHLDAAHQEVNGQLVERLQANAALAPFYIHLLFIVRHLERVGDHAVNLAEQAVYASSSKDIRHFRHGGPVRVLFLCVHNSARSQMAEAWLRHFGGDMFEIQSAGLEPGTLNPLAVQAMAEVGIDISRNETKSVFDLFKSGKMFHYVIAVCDKASAERCPVFPGITQRLDWSFPDPSKATGTREEQLREMRAVRDAIRARIEAWVSAKS